MKTLPNFQVEDVRGDLYLVPGHRLQAWRQPNKTNYTLHYAAVKVPHRTKAEALRTLGDRHRGFIQNHINRIGADGLQYHYVICGDGTILQTRDLDQGLWSCANYEGNRDSIHINLPLAPNEQPTPAQWAAFTRLVDALVIAFGWEGRSVGKGHREWPRYNDAGSRVPNSSCPGDVLQTKLDAFRSTTRKAAALARATPKYAIDGFECGRGFFDFYHQNGGLLVFGRALGVEHYGPDTDGEWCAWMDFENATLKYKPSLPAPWNLRPILLSEAVALRSNNT